ncbi:hypothetical protein M413DRAFT_241815 [Hebeloma cylindrosporum]|uniref:Peroxidase n=1 Tax=Hebeloma cylindrosporum TaxID=76867 RepID=A0A0C3BP52_HEBCY|nr:hypothetical protein M413DRAFT_241815 [Hebeloma cylindrosporum h7]
MIPIVWTVAFLPTLTLFVLGYEWPSPQYDALETFLYEGRDLATSDISSIVGNCKLRSSPDSMVAAEWLRFAYHDAATHNITDGTGGLDGSIFFELDRAENAGAGMRDTVRDFEVSADKYISRADIVALGAVWGVAACAGPPVPFRGGRRAALGPGPLGVPEPNQDLATHTEKFRLQGFSPSEMIALVACGHTIGSVRSSDFPNLAPRNNSDSSGIGLSFFDSTRNYDSAIATEYIGGTTKNPLITTSDLTFASDLRIFSSDGNATMNRLQSAAEFAQTCSAMIAKMINTVPSDVTLTDEIVLLPVKVASAYITVVKDRLIFSTFLRLSHADDVPDPTNRTVNLLWCDKRGENKDCSGKINVATNPVVGTPPTSPLAKAKKTKFLGYDFAVPILANQSVSKFWFEVNEGNGSAPIVHDNGGDGYIFPQDEVIYVPWLSTRAFKADGAGLVSNGFTIVAGIRSELKPTKAMLHAYDGTGRDQPPPYNATIDLVSNSSIALVDGYSAYSAIANNGARFLLNVDLEVVVDGISYKFDYGQTTFIDKSQQLDKFLSTVTSTTATSPIPGTTGKSSSFSPRLPSPVGAIFIVLVTVISVLC